jgi:hypothetical protein
MMLPVIEAAGPAAVPIQIVTVPAQVDAVRVTATSGKPTPAIIGKPVAGWCR